MEPKILKPTPRTPAARPGDVSPLLRLVANVTPSATPEDDIDITSESTRTHDGFGFEVFVNGTSCYKLDGYPNERSRDNALATHRQMARRLAIAGAAELRRDASRPYTVAVVATTTNLGKHLWDLVSWRLDLRAEDADVVFTTYGRGLDRGTKVDGIVFVHPAIADYEAAGTVDNLAGHIVKGGWRCYIGGAEPWPDALDLLR